MQLLQTSISDTFNNYFTSVAENIKKTIPTSNKKISTFLKNPVANSIFMTPTDTNEVLNCISSLDLNKSTGPFSIPSNIITLLKHDSISEPISKIINLSFSTGIFPSNLKIAKVIPVFKKGSKLECIYKL